MLKEMGSNLSIMLKDSIGDKSWLYYFIYFQEISNYKIIELQIE